MHAAVSSSSPWLAKVDMQEYQDIVGDSLAIASVGGSDACKAAVVDGHAAIAQMIASAASRAALATQFDFCDVSLPSFCLLASFFSVSVSISFGRSDGRSVGLPK